LNYSSVNFPSLIVFLNVSSIEFYLAFASNSISEYLLFFFVTNQLVDLKIFEQVVNATEIGTLTRIITGTAIEFLIIPNSENVIKTSI